MPLESATFISDLVTSNPAASDPLSNADDHIRLIKGALKATFPNFTAAALASTNAQLDAAGTAASSGASVLADAGMFFKTNTTDGIKNPSAGEIDLVLQGAVAAKFATTMATLSTGLTLTGTNAFKGAGVVPIGSMTMWLTDTLPTDGQWCWANGGTLSRTGNGAALFSLWGTTYGAGDGATTFNVINMQEAVPVGKSTMGGAGSPGLLNSVAGSVKAVLNGVFGEDRHTQTASEMPSHFHSAGVSDSGHGHASSHSGVGVPLQGSSGIGLTGSAALSYNNAVFSINTSTTGVRVSSPNGLDTTYSAGGGSPFNIIQPSRVVNYIIRIG